MTKLSRVIDAAPIGRNLTAVQVAAMVSCAALLFIAFRIGCLRGLDYTIGTDAWGRMLFGIGGAITDQVFGIKGYALGRTIEGILSLNGLTGDAATLQNLGVSYPANLRNPVLIQDAIEQAASSPYGPGALRGASGDDPGFIDFVKLSFALFGQTILSLYLTYFVLVAIEIAAFLVAFWNRPSCLALLTAVLVAHACMINSSLFDHDIGLGSVNNPRFLSTLAIIPALHVAMLVIWREPMTLSGIILVAIQSVLAALAIWIRSSAAWVIIALLALLAGSLIIDLRRRREGWGRSLVSSWPIAIFLAVVAGHAIFVRQTLNPVYAEQGEVSYHNFWNLLLDWMQVHPDLDKKFGTLFDGVKGDGMSLSASRVYLQRHPSEEQPTDRVDGRLTLAAVEKYSRAVLFEIARQDPMLVAQTFFYYKPRLLINAFVQQLSSLGRNSLSWVSVIALFWAALIARWPGESRRLMVISVVVSAGFLVSLIPVLITIGFGQAIADQFYILLIAAGTWTLSGLALLAQFGHRQLVGWTLARNQTTPSSSVTEPVFVAGTVLLVLLAAAFGTLNEESSLTLPESAGGPVVTQETTLAELPEVTTDGVTWIGITGLHAERADGDPVVMGQSVLRLVAVPTEGRHYLAAQSTGLDKNRVHRITAWVKAAPGVKVELELGDGSTNYEAIFDPARRRVTSSTPGLNGGVEQGPHGWQKIWIDLATVKDQLVVVFGIVSRDRSTFKGDGGLGVTFGGVEVAPSPSPGVRNPHQIK